MKGDCGGSRQPSSPSFGEAPARLPSQPLWQYLSLSPCTQSPCGSTKPHNCASSIRRVQLGFCAQWSLPHMLLCKAPAGVFPPENPPRIPPKVQSPMWSRDPPTRQEACLLRCPQGHPRCSLRVPVLQAQTDLWSAVPTKHWPEVPGPNGDRVGQEVGVGVSRCWRTGLHPQCFVPPPGDCPWLCHSGRGAVGPGGTLGKAGRPQVPCPSEQEPKCSSRGAFLISYKTFYKATVSSGKNPKKGYNYLTEQTSIDSIIVSVNSLKSHAVSFNTCQTVSEIKLLTLSRNPEGRDARAPRRAGGSRPAPGTNG